MTVEPWGRAFGLRLIVVALSLCLPAASVGAQATLKGRVVSLAGGKPLPNAEIVFPALRRSAHTGANGRFTIDSLPAGSVNLEIRLIGYKPIISQIELRAGDRLEVEISLRPAAQELDSVTVTVPTREFTPGYLSEFEQRRAMGLGEFLTRDQLRAQDNLALSDVLRSFRTVRLTPRQSHGMSIVSRRGAAVGECPLAIWVDGLYKGALEPFTGLNGVREALDVDEYLTDRLDAVEVYTKATLPVQFEGPESHCGAIILWTRRR